ncbi:unnamed protein product [Mytilus edulis]|uniref:WD repeat-containing protein on Y chromosome n=1 Tax=Mytilus edulis TaxID=6550 RepID=A0A8S3V3G0_MYTED|nr:unnamed protein product [Mytilus edulis]
MLTLPASKAISSNHHLHKGSDKSSINLPEIKQTVQFTGSTKSVPKSESTNTNSAKRKFTKKGDKKEEFDPDKIAAAVRYAQLQAIFAADEDGLDIDEFKDAMRKTVGHRMTDTEIEFLFMKVDANCDEKVDWEEYVTYNLLEYQGKTLMIEMMRQRPLHKKQLQYLKKAGKNFIDHTNGKYVTLSKEGLMSTWNMNMKHLESYHVITDVADRATHPWMVDMACMYNVGMIALSSTDRDITLYDIHAYFNPVLQTLIIATNQLAMLEKTDEEVQVAEIRSHNKPVVTAIYNKTFRFIVSACQDSVISVWDLHSGEKVIQTVNAHSRTERGFEVPVEITTMTFDGPQRRVITGARDGSVKVWNFNNGNCLQTFITPENMEVSGVASVNHRIIVAGWSRQVHIFLDGGDEEYRKDWKQKHNEDILCMTHLSPNIIATGSYDGDIIVWSRDTGQLYCTLNASKGTQPIGENKTKCFEIRPEPALNEIQEDEISLDILKTFGSVANEEMMKMKTRNQSPVSEESNKNQLSRREEYDELCKLYESAIECILFLESRDRENGETAIMMTSGAEGWVRAWSIHHQGGLLGQFNASHKVGESVHTMSTDINNKLLFTADSCGYVKIWDITEYCTRSVLSASQRASRWNYLNETFTYVRLMYCSEEPPASLVTAEKRPPNIATRPPPSSTLPKITLKWPFLSKLISCSHQNN